MNDKPQLVITFDPETRQVGVSGCIGDKVLAYGMLDAARDAIREFIAKNQSNIIPVTGNGGMSMRR